MAKIATDIEQGKRLEGIVHRNTADMFWLVTSETRLHPIMEDLSKYDRWEHYRAWSLDALINLFPCCKDDDAPVFELTRGGWTPSFTHNWFASWRGGGVNIEVNAKEAVDAVFGLIEELKRNNLM